MKLIKEFKKKMNDLNCCSSNIDEYISLDELLSRKESETKYEDEVAAYKLNFNKKKVSTLNKIKPFLCSSKMTIDEFLFMVSNYETPKELYDSVYNREKFTNARDNEKVRLNLIDYRNEIKAEMNKIAINLSRGHNTELHIMNSLQRQIDSQNLVMFLNVYIGNAENDILLVCNKGVFTIEIKDHSSTMCWYESGKFSEVNYGKFIEKPVDPYEQTIKHEIEFNKKTNSNLCRGVVILANENMQPTILREEVKERVFFLDEFITFINGLPDVLSADSINKIVYAINKLKINKNPKFDFYDWKKIDERFLAVLDFYGFNVYKKYENFDERVYYFFPDNIPGINRFKRIYTSVSRQKIRKEYLKCGYFVTFLTLLSYIYLYFERGLIPYDIEIICFLTVFNVIPRITLNTIYRNKTNAVIQKQRNFLKNYNYDSWKKHTSLYY